MRKIFSLLVVLMLAFVIAACGDNNDNNENESNGNTEEDNNAQNEANNENDANNENEAEEDNAADKDNDAGNDNAANNNDEDYEEAALEAFADFLIYLEANGLEVGEAEAGDPMGAESINAKYNILVPVEDIEAQFFYFEDKDSDEYKQGLEDQEITIDAAGEEFDLGVYIAGDYGFLDYEYHVAGDDVTKYMDEF